MISKNGRVTITLDYTVPAGFSISRRKLEKMIVEDARKISEMAHGHLVPAITACCWENDAEGEINCGTVITR